MSNVITLRWPSAWPRNCDAVTPPDGPDSRSRAGERAASVALIALPLESSSSRLRGAEPGLERLHVAADDRPEVGVDERRRGALVLAEPRRNLAGDRDVDAGQLVAEDLRREALMVRVLEGPQKTDRDRLDVGLPDRRGGETHVLLGERAEHVAAVVDPLADPEHECARGERALGPAAGSSRSVRWATGRRSCRAGAA